MAKRSKSLFVLAQVTAVAALGVPSIAFAQSQDFPLEADPREDAAYEPSVDVEGYPDRNPAASDEIGRTADTGVGRVGKRLSRDRNEQVSRIGRIANRIENRIDTRIDSRIGTSVRSNADAASQVEASDNRSRAKPQPR